MATSSSSSSSTILRQETLLCWNRSKAKFVPCWAILRHHPTDGPVLSLYADTSAKKAIYQRLALAPVASDLRFGATSRGLQQDPGGSPTALAKDKDPPTLDRSLLVAIPNVPNVPPMPGTSRKSSTSSSSGRWAPVIWLCALSVGQLFEFIKILADSLGTLGLPAPMAQSADTPGALHNYRPRPFRAQSAWEHFWDNPPAPKPPNDQRSAQITTITLEGVQRTTMTDEIIGGGGGGKMATRKKGEVGGPSNVAVVDQYQHTPVHTMAKAKELKEIPFERSKDGDQQQQGVDGLEQIPAWITVQTHNQQKSVSVPSSSLSSSSSSSSSSTATTLKHVDVKGEAEDGDRITISGAKTFTDAEVQTEQTMMMPPTNGMVAEQCKCNNHNCAGGDPLTDGHEGLSENGEFILDREGSTRFCRINRAFKDGEEQTVSTQL